MKTFSKYDWVGLMNTRCIEFQWKGAICGSGPWVATMRYARLLWEFWKRDSELFPPEVRYVFGGLGHQLLAGCGVWMCPVVQIPSRHRATDTGKRKEPEQSATCSWKPSMTFLDFWFSVHSVHSFLFFLAAVVLFTFAFVRVLFRRSHLKGIHGL